MLQRAFFAYFMFQVGKRYAENEAERALSAAETEPAGVDSMAAFRTPRVRAAISRERRRERRRKRRRYRRCRRRCRHMSGHCACPAA